MFRMHIVEFLLTSFVKKISQFMCVAPYHPPAHPFFSIVALTTVGWYHPNQVCHACYVDLQAKLHCSGGRVCGLTVFIPAV